MFFSFTLWLFRHLLFVCDMWHVTCDMWHVKCHMSQAFYLSLKPIATDVHLLTPPLFIVDWFKIHKKPYGRHWISQRVRIVTPIQKKTGQKQTDRKKSKKRRKRLCVTCHVLGVRCHVSCFTYHLLMTPTASATDPPAAISPTMHSRLVSKNRQKIKTQTIIKLPHMLQIFMVLSYKLWQGIHTFLTI